MEEFYWEPEEEEAKCHIGCQYINITSTNHKTKHFNQFALTYNSAELPRKNIL